MTTIEMRVHVDCPGCESKIKKALQRLKGVDNVDIDMALRKVTVTGSVDQKKVLRKVRKTGRRAELWQFPGKLEYHNTYATNQHNCNGPVTGYASRPSSSYNYYKHGYDYGHDSHNYNQNAPHTTILGHEGGATFSDENPHGCSVM